MKKFYIVILFCWLCGGLTLRADDLTTEKLVLVTLDGVRCEELFGGVDLSVIKHFANKRALASLPTYRKFWADTAAARRVKLMPFFWGQLMVEDGSVIGNASKGSVVHLRNRWRISFPGYSEILTGIVDDKRIKNNDAKYNPNQSVLEAVQQHRGLGFHQVAAFASWDVMRYIVQRNENTLFTNTGFDAYVSENRMINQLSDLQFETRTPWDSVRSDAYTFRFALHHMERYHPDLLYLALGETDDWAHDKRYDRVLEAIHQADQYLQRLWKWLEEDPEYAGRTTVLITTDHGRGSTPFTWHSHNERLPGARNTWLAVVHPRLKKRGEWAHHRRVYSAEIAATVGRFVGYELGENNPKVAKPIEFLFEN